MVRKNPKAEKARPRADFPRATRAQHALPLLSYYEPGPVDSLVSRVMSRNRGKNTAPEVEFRRALWRAGVRYRCHPADLPGRPDIAHRTSKVAVFVDGCFWHGCPKHFRPPRTRTAFWREKIRRNKETRRRVLDELGPSWKTFQLYECDLERNFESAVGEVAAAIQDGRRNSASLTH